MAHLRAVNGSHSSIGDVLYIADMQFITKAYRTAAPWAWPSLCRLCERWQTGAVCPDCLTKHLQSEPRCRLCAMPGPSPICADCQQQAPLWQRGAAALPYEEPWRALITSFKFNAELGLVRFFGPCLRQQAASSGLLSQSDLVLPVPLSRERLRERGFNQALLLAQALRPPDLLPDGLLRLRHTLAQSGLPRHQRELNLTHAIACNPRHTKRIRGQRVLLVDDVMTTGSTLQVCTQALLNAGAQAVNVLVLARAAGHQAPQSGSAH